MALRLVPSARVQGSGGTLRCEAHPGYGGRGPAGRGGGVSPTRRHTLARNRSGTWLGLEGRPTHPYVRPFLRLRAAVAAPHRRATPYSVNRWPKAQIVSEVQERCKVAYAGPHPLIPPATYRVGVGSETAVHLRPRQVGLVLEPHQALREVLGEVVCSSAVVSALSRHGRQYLSRTAAIPSATGMPRPSAVRCAIKAVLPPPRSSDSSGPGEAASPPPAIPI